MYKKILLTLILLLGQSLNLCAKDVYVGGESIGIKVTYEGVLITGTYDIEEDGEIYNPQVEDLRKEDIIVAVDGVPIKSVKELSLRLAQCEQMADVTIIRDNNRINRNLKIFMINSQLKTGLFVKDELLGIGTLTYIDPENKTFAALGHEIIDSDTKKVVTSPYGNIYRSKVVSINKAKTNKPGEKNAKIDFDSSIGVIKAVNQFGTFGTIQDIPQLQLIPTASMNEIELGEAEMLTVLENDTVETIKIVITNIHLQDTPENKGIEFEVIDKRALQLSNGIVQGMSGSPIIQNGHLIGAVTHVATNKPSIGYGLFIEWMLAESSAIT